MPITADVLHDGFVWVYTITGHWETIDLINLFPQELAHRERVNHRVHTLIDVTGTHAIPGGLLRTQVDGPTWTHRTGGELVLVGASALGRTTAQLFFQGVGFEKTRYFDSLAEGWAYLHNVLATQPHGLAEPGA